MKKSTKIIVTAVAILCVAVLVMFNRNANKAQEELVNSKQLTVIVKDEEKKYKYDENSEDYVSFDTQMKRKNGDVFDKNYSGIALNKIVAECGVQLTDDTKIIATCADNYQVELTAEEIKADGNIYLVTAENGETLKEEDGVFMLVINNDEFSTRWAKNIISITIE